MFFFGDLYVKRPSSHLSLAGITAAWNSIDAATPRYRETAIPNTYSSVAGNSPVARCSTRRQTFTVALLYFLPVCNACGTSKPRSTSSVVKSYKTSDLCRIFFFDDVYFRQQTLADGAATICTTQATQAMPENNRTMFAPSDAQLNEGEALLLKIRRSTTTRTDADGCVVPRKSKDELGPGVRHRVEVGQNVVYGQQPRPICSSHLSVG